MELVRDNYLEGNISKINVDTLDTFFEENYSVSLSNSGVESFLKTLKIPVKYFLKQPFDTQMELLQNQKNLMCSSDTLLLFKRGDIIEYVSLGDDLVVCDLAERTPVNDSWIFLGESLSSGYIRYFMPSNTLKEDVYNLGVYIDYPILFSKPMIINAGFYKLNNIDSTLNHEIIIPDTRIKLKYSELPNTELNTYFKDMLISIKDNKLEDIISFLENSTTDSETCIELLLSFEKEKLIHKSTSKKIRKYIDKECIEVENTLSLVDIMSSFINELKTHSSKMKYRTDILFCILKTYKKLPCINYLLDFKEGY